MRPETARPVAGAFDQVSIDGRGTHRISWSGLGWRCSGRVGGCNNAACHGRPPGGGPDVDSILKTLLPLSRRIDAFNTWLGKRLSWLILAAVLVSAVNASVRKIFDTSSNSWLELQWVLFSIVFLLCSPWTLLRNEHIRIDIVNNAAAEAAAQHHRRGRSCVFPAAAHHHHGGDRHSVLPSLLSKSTSSRAMPAACRNGRRNR